MRKLYSRSARRQTIRRAGNLILFVGLLTCGADAATQKPKACAQSSGFTEQDLAAARPENLSPQGRLPADDPDRFKALVRESPMAGRTPWLILSSGGENGAFAAGLLIG